MEISNNYLITVTIEWHQVACIAYFVPSNYIDYYDANYQSACDMTLIR